MFSFETAGGCSASSSSALKISDRICARTLPRTPRASSVCFNAAACRTAGLEQQKKEKGEGGSGGWWQCQKENSFRWCCGAFCWACVRWSDLECCSHARATKHLHVRFQRNGRKWDYDMVQHLFYIYSIDCCCKPKNQSYNPKMCIPGLQPFCKQLGNDQKKRTATWRCCWRVINFLFFFNGT